MRELFLLGFLGISSLGGYFQDFFLPNDPPKVFIQYPKDNLQAEGTTLRFHVIGDFGEIDPYESSSELPCTRVAEVMNAYAEKAPISMIVSVGDNYYPNTRSELFETIDTVNEEIFTGEAIHNIPWYLAYGNHDLYQEGDYGKDLDIVYHNMNLFKAPWNMTLELENFSVSFTFLSGDLVCFGPYTNYVLDRQCAKMRSERNSTAEYEWIEQHFKDLDEDPSIVWKIVVIHYPIFSVSTTGLDSENMKLLLLPLLGEYGIDFVFAGHNHNMQYFVVDRDRVKDFKKQEENIECLDDPRIVCGDAFLVCRNRSVKCEENGLSCEDKICIDEWKGYLGERKMKSRQGKEIHQVVQGSGGADIDPMCPFMESPMADYVFGLVEYGFSEVTITKEMVDIKFILANDSSIVFESIVKR